MLRNIPYLSLISAALAVPPVFAQGFALPAPQDEVIGAVTTVTASKDETLLDIARRFDIGQNEILMANPSVDRWLPADGAEVTIPSSYILPRADRVGLVLNVPEMRLYYYPPSIPDLPERRADLSREHRAHGLVDPAGHHPHRRQDRESELAASGIRHGGTRVRG